jgi:ubiquinone/menaquinone biosynthesis C-methylase UbiE
MKLNFAETLLVNNPVRALVQRRFEGPLLGTLAGDLRGARVLEIGCGSGNGLGILARQFGAGEIWAIDIDLRQLRRARRRFQQAALSGASADMLPFRDGAFDAVFDFGVLHHVPDWRRAVSEIRRVLKPGGRFLFEEVTRAALDRPLYRAFFDHPRENRFSEAEFLTELAWRGIAPYPQMRRVCFGDIFIGAGIVIADPDIPLIHEKYRARA